jgi:pSer/pThr/pTyr-binding forkhead associated (FHA) protein
MQDGAGAYSSAGLPVVARADQTDEYPMLFARDLDLDEALPSFLEEPRLEVLSGPDEGVRFPLGRIRTVIGRGQSAHVRIRDTRMSKQHATILYSGSEFRIRDEKSTNGTFLNGSQVVEYAIRDGDKLLVGDTLLRFRVGSVTAR